MQYHHGYTTRGSSLRFAWNRTRSSHARIGIARSVRREPEESVGSGRIQTLKCSKFKGWRIREDAFTRKLRRASRVETHHRRRRSTIDRGLNNLWDTSFDGTHFSPKPRTSFHPRRWRMRGAQFPAKLNFSLINTENI